MSSSKNDRKNDLDRGRELLYHDRLIPKLFLPTGHRYVNSLDISEVNENSFIFSQLEINRDLLNQQYI